MFAVWYSGGMAIEAPAVNNPLHGYQTDGQFYVKIDRFLAVGCQPESFKVKSDNSGVPPPGGGTNRNFNNFQSAIIKSVSWHGSGERGARADGGIEPSDSGFR